MKKNQKAVYAGALLLLLFIVGSVLVFMKSNQMIKEGYLASEGEAAENFAVLTARSIHLTDEQVENLKNMSYAELMNSEENQNLKAMMSDENFATEVDYAYLMVHLKDSEVKYTVTEESQARFNAPVGTKLDIMWLLDVNVSDSATAAESTAGAESIDNTESIAGSESVDNTESTAGTESTDATESTAGTDELTRYSYYIDDDAHIFNDAPTYIYNSSEWGDHICGYAPLYSTEGNYIGVIGVELKTHNFNTYCGNAMKAMGILMGVSLLLLTLVFVFVYRQFKKMQYDKIYTDALTKLCNRSYYNDQFIKYLNGHKKSGTFALMIADVDWFKKVNDTFGHETGDDVLIEVAQILSETFGKKHTVRLGGEEFVIGMWIESEAVLRQQLDALYEKMTAHRFTSQQIIVSISLGCSIAKADELNGWITSGMLKAADLKLYECKENGRNQYRLGMFETQKE